MICEEWHDFKPFMDWALSNGYDDALTIDRIDNDGNYEPSNCRWVGNDIQGYNRRVFAKNKTGVTGVRYRIKDRKYEALIGHKGKQIYLGLFDDVADATKARKAAEGIYCPTARL